MMGVEMNNGRKGDLAVQMIRAAASFVASIKNKGKVTIGFKYPIEIVRPDGTLQAKWNITNLMPDAAIQQFMASGLDAASQVSSFYIGAYANERTPLATDTAANIPDYGEIVSWSEGTRQLWVKGSLQGNKYDSAASPTVLTATETVIVTGVFMSTMPTFGSTAGFLWSAALAPTPETVNAGSQLRIPASIELVNT